MDRLSFSDLECPTARAIDVLADPWCLLLMRTAFLGACRFQDFVDQLNVPPTTLSRKLQQLVDHELLGRAPSRRGAQRQVYALTPKGLEVLPILLAMAAWGAKWQWDGRPPLEFSNPAGTARIEPVVVDRLSREPLRAGEVAVRPGPGASPSVRRLLPTPRVLGAHES